MFENSASPNNLSGIRAPWQLSTSPTATMAPALDWPYGAVVLAVAAAYFLAASVGLLLAIPPGYASPIWPPAGIALAAWLAAGRAALPGVFVGAAIANIGVLGTAPVVALAIGAGNAAEALVAGLLIERWAGSRHPFDRTGAVAGFAASVFAAALVAASNGVLVLCLAGQVPWTEFATHWTTWWLGDATGMVIVAPLLLCWRDAPAHRRRERGRAWYALSGALLLLCAALTRREDHAAQDAVQTLAYLMIPLVTWAATRLDRRAVTVASFAVSAIVVVDVLDGHAAPFASLALNDSLLLMQLIVSSLAATGLMLSALSAETARASQGADSIERQAAADRVESLARRLVQVRDEERRHLAAELHDGLAQRLTALNVSLDLIRARATAATDSWLLARLDEAESACKRASQCIRDIMVGMRSPEAEAPPISSLLRRHAAAFESRTGILVQVHAPVAPVRVAPEIKEVLVRICLEALNNASRHADAAAVRVTLRNQADAIVLAVTDDGSGFDATQVTLQSDRPRLGLRIMEERALSIGATLRIASTPGAGTTVEVAVPGTSQQA